MEGIEALIPALDTVINTGADLGLQELILGMAHRGRLNVLVNVFGKDYEQVFSEFEGTKLPTGVKGDGDVKYHLGHSADVVTPNGKQMHLALAANPSHLEAVNPVVLGMVQAKLQNLYGTDIQKIVPIFIHGDAALAGQGVNYEVVQMSNVPGYANGGALHIVLNNQIGFTTSYHEARSSVYCTALAKITESPVFHVNADDPEAVVHAVRLAIRIRQEFGIDAYVDILGYRRYGHNEGDEPRFTQPELYAVISGHDTVRTLYLNKLISEGVLTEESAEALTTAFKDKLQKKLDSARKKKAPVAVNYLKRLWEGLRPSKPSDFEKSISTGVKVDQLTKVAKALSKPPKDFKLYAKTQKIFESRRSLFFEQQKVDWAMAELLAYGTLLTEDNAVRLSGQDCQRGTFSHRHAVVKDESETR
ncbi:MAG: thiamine pyrophosphate-dependent enzyme, partial [Candidatus Margulisiibacteriota bacterium]